MKRRLAYCMALKVLAAVLLAAAGAGLPAAA